MVRPMPFTPLKAHILCNPENKSVTFKPTHFLSSLASKVSQNTNIKLLEPQYRIRSLKHSLNGQEILINPDIKENIVFLLGMLHFLNFSEQIYFVC